jgi:hypothetical protein
MEQNSFWDANSHSASQEILYVLWNPNFHYVTTRALDPTPSQKNSPHTFTLYSFKIHLIVSVTFSLVQVYIVA